MKLRVVYNEKEIISVDKPEGAAAINYDLYNLSIADHTQLIPMLTDAGLDISKVKEMLLYEGITISQQ